MSTTTTRGAVPKPAETDAFSGLSTDLRAAYDKIDLVVVYFDQGLFSSLPTANAAHKGWVYWATDVGRAGTLYYCTGTAWIVPEPLIRPITNLASPGFAPVNGDEVDLSFTDYWLGDNRVWRLRYNGNRTVRKWQGGYPIVVDNPGFSMAMTGSSSAFTTFGGLAVSLPAPGRYRIDFHCYVVRTNGNTTARPALSVSVSEVGGGVAKANDARDALVLLSPQQDDVLNGSVVVTTSTSGALAGLTTQLLSDGGGAVTFSNAFLSATPLELGA